MADNNTNTNNTNNTNDDCYKITICSPDGKEEVYKANIAFLICDTGEQIEASNMCRNGFIMDIFQLVRVGQSAILEMIPEKYRKMYAEFANFASEYEKDE